MKIKLPEMITNQKTFTVTDETTAKHVGSGSVDVLSTPSMIAFMEKVSLDMVQDYLPEGYTTVGTHVCVNHKKAVKVNEEVNVSSEVTLQDRKKIEFAVKVMHNGDIVGEGDHHRFIIDSTNFMQ